MQAMASEKRCVPQTITPGVSFDVFGADGVMIVGIADAQAVITVHTVDATGKVFDAPGAEVRIDQWPGTFMIDVLGPAHTQMMVTVRGDNGHDIYALPYEINTSQRPTTSPAFWKEK
jgi:hypothetical protein